MASPFHYFRKNQKLFLALAGGTAMFVFVLADPLSKMLQEWSGAGPRQSSKKTVVLWDGDSINEQELANLTRRRYFISGFLRNLQIIGARRILDEGGTPLQPSIPNFMLSENPPPGSVETDVVKRRVFADLARKADIAISDSFINHYLSEVGFRRVTGAEIRSLLIRASQGAAGIRGAEDQLFSGLREMLLGEYYFNSYSSSVRNVLPEQRWQDWLVINKRIALEAAILPTDQFLTKTEDPNDDELKRFYDDNKDRLENTIHLVGGVPLPSYQAGFKEPRRVRLQYLLGDVTAWTENLLDAVTDEEIADYYERNKRAQFAKSDDNSSAAETQEEASDSEPDEEVEYEPLESVSEQIRRQLANDKAVVELKRIMELAYAELDLEYNDYGGRVITAQSQEQSPPAVPAKLANLSGMAKEHGLVSESTTALSGRQLADTFVGKAVDIQTGRLTVTRAAFTSMPLHEPFLAQDLDGQWYLVIKTEDQASHTPEFNEIRDKVVASWKQSKAAEIALETAQQLAKEAQEADGTLATFFADKGYEVVTTDLFSTRTFGTTPSEMRGGARLGEAPPLTAIGLNFMSKAFQLEPNEVVALQNYDHSNAYVARLDRREKTNDELRQLFLSEANSWYGRRMMMAARWQYTQQQLQKQLYDRIGLDAKEFSQYLQELSSR